MAGIDTKETAAKSQGLKDEKRSTVIILRALLFFSILATIVFSALSYLNREVGYYLVAISALITVLFGLMAALSATKK